MNKRTDSDVSGTDLRVGGCIEVFVTKKLDKLRAHCGVRICLSKFEQRLRRARRDKQCGRSCAQPWKFWSVIVLELLLDCAEEEHHECVFCFSLLCPLSRILMVRRDGHFWMCLRGRPKSMQWPPAKERNSSDPQPRGRWRQPQPSHQVHVEQEVKSFRRLVPRVNLQDRQVGEGIGGNGRFRRSSCPLFKN